MCSAEFVRIISSFSGAIACSMLMFIICVSKSNNNNKLLPARGQSFLLFYHFMEIRSLKCNLKSNIHCEGTWNAGARIREEKVAAIACQTSISFSARLWHLTKCRGAATANKATHRCILLIIIPKNNNTHVQFSAFDFCTWPYACFHQYKKKITRRTQICNYEIKLFYGLSILFLRFFGFPEHNPQKLLYHYMRDSCFHSFRCWGCFRDRAN